MTALVPTATFSTATFLNGLVVIPTGLISADIIFDIVKAAIEQRTDKRNIETGLAVFHIVQRFED